MRESGGQPLARAAASTICATSSCCCVLDNFEQVLDAAPLVAELLAAAPRLKVLVDQPRGAAPAWRARVRGAAARPARLAAPAAARAADAVRGGAAVHRARAGGQARLRRHATRMRRRWPRSARLDGLPLAIELAAARSKLLPPRRCWRGSTSRLHAADRRRRATCPRASRRCATRSTGATTCSTRPSRRSSRGWRCLSGGCTLEAAEAVLADARCGDLPPISVELVLDGLASLVDKSLLKQARGGRRAALS